MKAPYFLIKYILASFAIVLLYYLFRDSDLFKPQYCMSRSIFEATVVSNLFFDITQDEYGVSAWKIFFKNVNVSYQVTSEHNDNFSPIQSFKFTQLNAEGEPVERTITNTNIVSAAGGHFNDIQRGNYHSNLANVINPNSHGRGVRSPLDQFEIRNLLSLDAPILGNLFISLTNIGLYLTIAAFISLTMSFLSTNYNKVVANN